MSFLFAFTLLHVAISLIGIGAGFVVLYQMLQSRESGTWTKWFLVMTVLTSVTAFGFPVSQILPSHVFAVISLIALGLAIYARSARLAGGWRTTYVVTAILSQYLNLFVLIVQSFLKIPALHALAPTQSEPPFAVAQGLTLIAFIVVGVLAVKRFRAAPQTA